MWVSTFRVGCENTLLTNARAYIVSDEFSGGAGDWARGVAGIKYSFEIELRDRGQKGFLLPTRYILPVGDEMWSAVRVLTTHIVAEMRHELAVTTPGIFYTNHSHTNRSRTSKLPTDGLIHQLSNGGSGVQAVFSIGGLIILNLVIYCLRLSLYVDDNQVVPFRSSSWS